MAQYKIFSGDSYLGYKKEGVFGETPSYVDLPSTSWKPAFRNRVYTCRRESLLGMPESILLERHGRVVLRAAKSLTPQGSCVTLNTKGGI